MDIHRKYPRTPHLPFSRSHTSDDVFGQEWAFFSEDADVVVTEKMDGESTTFYRDGFHARSLDSRFHPSRSWVAGLWGQVSWQLPENRRIILENMYAEHSIRYEALPTFAFGIGVVDVTDSLPCFLSWDDTLEIFADLGITPVPTLYRGRVTLGLLREIFENLDVDRQEGIVVRSASSFPEADFSSHVGKAVRPGHVQTEDHWTRTWKPNSLAG